MFFQGRGSLQHRLLVVILGSYDRGACLSHISGYRGDVVVVSVGHRDHNPQAETDDSEGSVAPVDSEHDLLAQLDVRFFLKHDGIHNHCVFVLGEQPAALGDGRTGDHLRADVEIKQVDGLPFAPIRTYATCRRQAVDVGLNHAWHLPRFSLDPGQPVWPIKEDGAVELIVFHQVIYGAIQRGAHADNADERGARQGQSDERQRQPPLATEDIAQRQQHGTEQNPAREPQVGAGEQSIHASCPKASLADAVAAHGFGGCDPQIGDEGRQRGQDGQHQAHPNLQQHRPGRYAQVDKIEVEIGSHKLA